MSPGGRCQMCSSRMTVRAFGGEVEMTYPHLRPDEQARITGIVVREFEGIDHLADTLGELRGVRGIRDED